MTHSVTLALYLFVAYVVILQQFEGNHHPYVVGILPDFWYLGYLRYHHRFCLGWYLGHVGFCASNVLTLYQIVKDNVVRREEASVESMLLKIMIKTQTDLGLFFKYYSIRCQGISVSVFQVVYY